MTFIRLCLLVAILFVHLKLNHADLFRENDEGKKKYTKTSKKDIQNLVKIQNPDVIDKRNYKYDKRTEIPDTIDNNKNTATKRTLLKKRHTSSYGLHHFTHSNRKRSKFPNNSSATKKLLTKNKAQARKGKNRFKSEKKYKKGEVYVIESSQADDDDLNDSDIDDENDLNDGSIDNASDDDTQEVTGERKETINHAAEDIVVDEDNNNNNNEFVTDPATIDCADGDDVISDTMKDGMSTQFLESSQMIKTNEDKGNYIPVDNPSKAALNNDREFEDGIQKQLKDQQHQLRHLQMQLEQQQAVATNGEASENTAHLELAKALAKQLTSPVESQSHKTSFTNAISSSSVDPALSKSVSTDLAIDKSISKAIVDQMEKDNELSETQAVQSMAGVKARSNNITSVGDFANIVEQAESQNAGKGETSNVKPNNIFSPISTASKAENEFLENADEKINSPISSYNNAAPVFRQQAPDNGFDVNPGIGTLSPSEQRLITSIDNAVRTKDVATELATRIMMPTKSDTLSDRTVAPSEQLLDMLAKGKFEKPLPDDVLTRLSNFNPNNQYLQEQGLNTMQSSPLLAKQFAKVGTEYIPVHSIAVDMPKTTIKPFIDAQQLAKAELLMKTDPAFLAQNNQILDGSKYTTLQDLSRIGETMYPSNVVNLNQPIMTTSEQHIAPPSQYHPPLVTHLQPHQQLTQQQMQTQLHEDVKPLLRLPPDIAKILKEYRANQNSSKTFEDAISDPPNKNTNDHFVPEKTITIAEEKTTKGSPQCKWNPCLNGGMCTAHPEKYYCSCKPGFVGDNCEKRSNCSPNPCHHGTCWPNIDGYTCTCKLGYKGSKCDMLDKCRPNPCENNGLCSETLRGVQCDCASGFKGRLCELEAKCEPVNPCMNGGICREYTDHYHCSCSSGFRGQNCEEFNAPTKPPPTIPIKHEGPQAIPAPDNIPSNVIHDLFATHTSDSDGNTYSTYRESVGTEPDSNPGVVMVPHIGSIGAASSNPEIESHNPFIGAPTQDSNDKFIIHTADEDKNKPNEGSKKLKNLTSDSITGKDDRYQTHFVESGEMKGSNGGVHVGKSIPGTSEPISLGTLSNPHPTGGTNEEKASSDAKLHVENVKQEHTEKVKKLDTNVHRAETGQTHSETSSINEIHNTIIENPDKTQTVIVGNANLHAEYDRPTEPGHVRSIVNTKENNKTSSSANSTNFINKDSETNSHFTNKTTPSMVTQPINKPSAVELIIDKTYAAENSSEKQSVVEQSKDESSLDEQLIDNPSVVKQPGENPSVVEQPVDKPSVVKQQIDDNKAAQEVKKVRDKAIGTMNSVNQHIQDKYIEAKKLAENEASKIIANARLQANNNHSNIAHDFTKQKNAYTEWRRKALINYHKRYPDKPLPKNTLSLSKNTFCPEFCRLYCDPWCVNIGCCRTTPDQLAMYKKIEEMKKIAAYKNLIASKPASSECKVCNANANCIHKKCVCKTGFHGDGVTCSIDNCLLCHLDAQCESGRCTCKNGFFGDGYECRDNKYKTLCKKCHKKADCIGGDCLCSRGYYGNGKSCWPLPILK